MHKIHDLKTVTRGEKTVYYFYIREKNDRNGNPRFRVFIIDPELNTVWEEIAKTYEGLLSDWVRRRVYEPGTSDQNEEALPF